MAHARRVLDCQWLGRFLGYGVGGAVLLGVGCMKGLSYHHLVHGKDRLRTPLIRTGERGSGEFREATWEEALDLVAGELARIGDEFGYESVHVFGQVPGSGYVHKGANYRARALLGMSHGTSFDFNGDLPMGMPITFGVQNVEHETKDRANSRFLLVVGANPLETRIPDAKFLFDALDAGARLVVADPVVSATAAKADTWLQLRPGSDAAFALGLAHVILAEGLEDAAFLGSYSDGPLLVRPIQASGSASPTSSPGAPRSATSCGIGPPELRRWSGATAWACPRESTRPWLASSPYRARRGTSRCAPASRWCEPRSSAGLHSR